MRFHITLLSTCCLVLPLSPVRAQTSPFNGVWGVTVSCPAVADAAGYALRFPARVTPSGDFLGENGSPGTPGYLHLAGRIGPDGTALLAAEGLVGSPRVAIGQLPALSPYRYTASTHFTADHGSGTRTTTRPCTLTFVRS